MIICPITSRKQRSPWSNHLPVYTEYLNVVAQANGTPIEPASGLHILKWAMHPSQASKPRVPVREIFPLDQLWSYCHVTPHFGCATDNCLTCYNSIYVFSTFLLNKYYDKDFYYVVTYGVVVLHLHILLCSSYCVLSEHDGQGIDQMNIVLMIHHAQFSCNTTHFIFSGVLTISL